MSLYSDPSETVVDVIQIRRKSVQHWLSASPPQVSEGLAYANVVTFYKKRSWCRQKFPYVRTLPYSVEKFHVIPGTWVWVGQMYWPPAHGPTEFEGTYIAVSRDEVHTWANHPRIRAALNDLEVSAKNGTFDLMAGQTWNVPVFFAELKKTSDLVLSFAAYCDRATRRLLEGLERVRRLQQQLRRGTLRVPDYSKMIADLWLQWRYAVETGIKDVQSAAKTTADLLLSGTQQEAKVFTANRNDSFDLGDLFGNDADRGSINTGMQWYANNITYRLQRQVDVQVKAWQRVVLDAPVAHEANQLGILNAPVFFWEVLPFSFVADWVLDVGNYLERLTSSIGFREIDAGYSTQVKILGHSSAIPGPTMYPWSWKQLSYGPSRYEYMSFYRSEWANPAPLWTPAFRMNSKRWADAAALLRQIGLKRVPT